MRLARPPALFCLASVALVLGLSLAPLPAARATEPTPEEQADRHSERGTVYFNLGQFEDAISEYRKGYEVLALPEFLFNIGQSYQQLGNYERALFFYRRYLATRPDAPNRPDVEARMAALEPLLPPDARLRGADVVEPLPAGRLSALRDPSGPDAQGDLRAPAPSDPAPVWQRWWVWTAAGAVVAGAAAVWLVSRSRRDGVPRSDLGNARFF